MIRLSRTLFFFTLIIACNFFVCEVVHAASNCNEFIIDTLFAVNYGNSVGMLTPQRLNPRRFTATKDKVYLLDADNKIIVYAINGQYIAEQKLPLEPGYITGILPSKTGFVITGSKKIYLADSTLELVDSLDYYLGSTPGRQFAIHEKAYFENGKDSQTLIEFNSYRNSFSVVKPWEVWGSENLDSVFPFFNVGRHSFLAGASKKLIIVINMPPEPANCMQTVSVYAKGKRAVELNGFCYDVYPTLNPENAFQFINDTTAIFNVRHFNPDNSVRDCVFYQITFFKK